MQTFVAAAVQMNAGLEKADNLARAESHIAAAARDGAQVVVLPELFSAYGPLPQVAALAEPIPGPTADRAAAWARRFGVLLCAGSIAELGPEGKAWNTSLLFDADGRLVAKYRKRHLFDVDVSGAVSRESDVMLPGETLAVVRRARATFGQAICYDLRFPELFRALSARGMETLLFPSAFTAVTGAAHWEPLIRARAIENQVFVIAANQVGEHGGGMTSYGHSCILDPWGTILSAAHSGENVILAELRGELLEDVRRRVPSLKNRRL